MIDALSIAVKILRIISFIEDSEIAKKILQYLNLWNVNRQQPPCANSPPAGPFIIYYESLSPSAADDYIIDAEYPIETCL